jgi:phage gpG-like protein
MITAAINGKNIQDVIRRLNGFQAAMADATLPNRQASIAMYGWLIRNYDREGAAIGGWAPLSPKTIAEKKKIGKEKMLVRTGALRQSFLPFHSKENAGVGSDIVYSERHEKGDPSSNLPARPMLPPREVVLDIGLKVYSLYVAREAKKANG